MGSVMRSVGLRIVKGISYIKSGLETPAEVGLPKTFFGIELFLFVQHYVHWVQLQLPLLVELLDCCYLYRRHWYLNNGLFIQ